MAERPIDIITDDQNKLWYELDNNPESRKGPFDDFVALGHDLEKVLKESTDGVQGMPNETGDCRTVDMSIDKKDNLQSSTNMQTNGKETPQGE